MSDEAVAETETGEALRRSEAADEEAPARPAGRGVTLLELTADSCRFPLGDILDLRAPVTELFCGVPAAPGSSYCPTCNKRAFVRKRPHAAAPHRTHRLGPL